MKSFWLSFWAAYSLGEFEIHSPWWISGERFGDAGDESAVCVACRAEDEEAAMEFIYQSFDNRPAEIEFRFVEERPDDWSPFGDRFRKRDWMQW